jgi:hypothetical protein
MEFSPGINFKTDLSFFSEEERAIINSFAKRDWYITRTKEIYIAGSSYKLILMKPSDFIKNAFNINREIVLAFSSYETFQPRSIDAIEFLGVQELRLEEICSIIVSKDNDVENKLGAILKSNEEARVIIPFSYSEILKHQSDPEYLVNKIRQKFYSRDLFGLQDPLKKDLYFFGRKNIIQTLLNRHLNSENSGIFGLRKTRKTSILYSVERALDRKKSTSLIIDCQTLHLKSWGNAIMFIIQELQQKTGVKRTELNILSKQLVPDFIADYFHEDIRTIYRKNNKKSILLIFDEIENITFDTSISENWKNGIDFIKFWQVIRSSYQRHRSDNVFSYLITGTNPRCIEKSTINKVDNPIFSQFIPIYIPPFDFPQTKEMIDKLGGYMGLKFDDIVGSKLADDFGGHPLLIRQMCSFIHRTAQLNRPLIINKTYYDRKRDEFFLDEQGFTKYIQMVLEVLEEWYIDEFQMLTWLSIGNYDTFKEYANEIPEYVKHLIHYGIIEKSGDDYGFKIEALKLYLSNKNKYKKLNLTNAEKQKEISERRNIIEPQLRRMVRQQLRSAYGEENAKKKVIAEVYTPHDTNKYISQPYQELFDPKKHNIYLNNVFELIRKKLGHLF